MREFTKSMMSYTWAISLFGVQQMFNVFRPSRAAESFDNVTDATRDELGDGMRAAFRAGDNLQRGMVDMAFGVFGLGIFNGRGTGCDVSGMGRSSGDIVRDSMNAVGQAADAFGRVTQGAASYAADATRQATGRRNRRGAWGGAENYDRTCDRAYDRGGRQASDAGQQAADAVGQTIGGAAYSAAAAVGVDQESRRDAADTSGARSQGGSAGQTQRWGAPSRGSDTSRRS
jgi:hypothetical protein